MDGKIVSINGGVYVIYANKATYNVFPKGNLRFKNKRLYVGDDVIFNDSTFVIEDVKERKNELIRPRSANIDQLLIVMSTKEPEFSLELIYKFLTYANMNNIHALLAITKMDMLNDKTKILEMKSSLEKLGIDVFLLSKDDDGEIENLKKCLDNTVTVIMGQTGVGKSSLLNKIDQNYRRNIGDYSVALGRGKHKTKEVILLPYKDGFIADTPGFSSLQLDIFKEDIAQFFPGYNKYYLNCYYSNCLHQDEKLCDVKKHIESNDLSPDGYKIYLKLLNELQFKKERYNK